MNIDTERQPSAFSIWLRTGLWPEQSEDTEYKFNPYHDPGNGRFTFAPGGGSFGGGGATGSWGASQRPKPAARSPNRLSTSRAAVAGLSAKPSSMQSSVVAPTPATVNQPAEIAQGSQTIVRNGYAYKIDAKQRTAEVSGTITLNDAQARSRSAQAAAGGTDRFRPTTVATISLAASTDRPTRSIISRRMRASIAATIAHWRTDGLKPPLAARKSRSASPLYISVLRSARAR